MSVSYIPGTSVLWLCLNSFFLLANTYRLVTISFQVLAWFDITHGKIDICHVSYNTNHVMESAAKLIVDYFSFEQGERVRSMRS
ncbi:hypothetical protein [Shewanella sp. 0m-4]